MKKKNDIRDIGSTGDFLLKLPMLLSKLARKPWLIQSLTWLRMKLKKQLRRILTTPRTFSTQWTKTQPN